MAINEACGDSTMFNQRKTAQMAAWFLQKAPGNRLPLLKLIKLMYLADREALDECGFPISGDCFVAMPHGPVLSRTPDLMNGNVKDAAEWDGLIADREDHYLALQKTPTEQDRDHLSIADRDTMDRVWRKFGAMTRWQLRDHAHYNCPEWQDPKGSSMPIGEQAIFEAMGRPAQQASALAAEIQAQRELSQMLNPTTTL